MPPHPDRTRFRPRLPEPEGFPERPSGTWTTRLQGSGTGPRRSRPSAGRIGKPSDKSGGLALKAVPGVAFEDGKLPAGQAGTAPHALLNRYTAKSRIEG